MSVNISKLKGKIVEMNTTQEAVADKLSIDKSTYYRTVPVPIPYPLPIPIPIIPPFPPRGDVAKGIKRKKHPKRPYMPNLSA